MANALSNFNFKNFKVETLIRGADNGVAQRIHPMQDFEDWLNNASGGGHSSGGDYSAFWNTVLSAAGDIITGLNKSDITSINFQNPQALYDIAFTDPGTYDLSIHNGTPTLTEVGDNTAGSAGSNTAAASGNGSSTVYYAMNGGTSDILNANQGGSVSMGQYGTLNIIQYSQYYDGKSMGVTINLGLYNTTGYKNLQWLQTISTNYPLRSDLKSPYFDHYPDSSLPFYPKVTNQHGFDFEFVDQPTRPVFGLNGGDDIYWRASLTLVGITGNSYFTLFNINYGFTIQSGIYSQIPMSFSTPLPVNQTFSPYFQKNGP